MAFSPAQLDTGFDANHGAVLLAGQPGFVANTDGSFTISQLVNQNGPVTGYGAFQDNNNGPFGTPSEQDLITFRVVDYNPATNVYNYFFDRENAALNGVNTSGPLGAILVGYNQVGNVQNFLLEQIAGYVAAPGGRYTGTPGTTYFLLSNGASLDNIDPVGNDIIPNAFFANGPVTFEPPSFNFAVPTPSMDMVLGLAFVGTLVARRLRRAA